MRKVFFITNGLSGGGAERVISVISNYLCDENINVNILVLRDDSESYSINNNVNIITYPRKKHDIIGQILFIRKYMKNNPEEVFVSFFTHQNMYTILASCGLNVRVIVSERNDPSRTVNNAIVGSIRSWLYSSKLCDMLVFQTKGAQAYFNERVRKKSVIIANPLKPDLPEPFIGVRKKSVVSFGRLVPQKNYATLIKAFASFYRKHTDYELFLYGEGDMRSELLQMCKDYEISRVVHFMGFCDNVHDVIYDAGIFVLPSNYEGLSNSMLEAMAIGLPVVCTDCPPGGAREYIVDHQNGVLVGVGMVEELSDVLCDLADNPQFASKMGKEAARIREVLETKVICNQWKNVFLGLTDG